MQETHHSCHITKTKKNTLNVRKHFFSRKLISPFTSYYCNKKEIVKVIVRKIYCSHYCLLLFSLNLYPQTKERGKKNLLPFSEFLFLSSKSKQNPCFLTFFQSNNNNSHGCCVGACPGAQITYYYNRETKWNILYLSHIMCKQEHELDRVF